MGSMYLFVSKYCKSCLFVHFFQFEVILLHDIQNEIGRKWILRKTIAYECWRKIGKKIFPASFQNDVMFNYSVKPIKGRSTNIYIGSCELILIGKSNFGIDGYSNMTGHLTLILKMTYWHFKTLFPWMHIKVNFIRTLHGMPGIPRNNLGLSQTHW